MAQESVLQRRGLLLSEALARMVLAIGAALSASGLAMIWIARSNVNRSVYVSELGADGMATEDLFQAALLAVAAGGFALALFGDRPVPFRRVLGAWPLPVTLGIASTLFVVASQVTCTAGCPVPFTDPRSTPADLIHSVSAVLGFVFACYGMLQVAFSDSPHLLSLGSLAACMLVAAITITGGLLSIVRWRTDIGGVFEFVGTSIAIAWLAVYSAWLAIAGRSANSLRPGQLTSSE